MSHASGDGWRFLGTALVWLIPALILLPFLLILGALSMAAADGSLLELAGGIRGKVLTALGPLLILSGIAAAVVCVVLRADLEGWLYIGGAGAIALVGGCIATSYAWRRFS